MNNIISLIGIDGSGKSTAIKQFMNTKRPNYNVLNVPQFYENYKFETTGMQESLLFEKIGKLADLYSLPLLKLNATFCAITLFQKFFNPMKNSQNIILERHIPLDAVLYGNIYFALLQQSNELNLNKARTILAKEISEKEMETLDQYSWQGMNIWDMHDYILQFRQHDKSAFLNQVSKDLMFPEINQIIFLNISKELLSKRMQGNQTEIHEDINLLLSIQDGYMKFYNEFKSKKDMVTINMDHDLVIEKYFE